MGMYNMLFRVHPSAPLALALLELPRQELGRFRDAWIDMGPDGLRIQILTRNGGYSEYASVFEELRKHPDYVKDWVEDYDPTYSSIEFSLPDTEEIIKRARRLNLIENEDEEKDAREYLTQCATHTMPPFQERWEKALDQLKSAP